MELDINLLIKKETKNLKIAAVGENNCFVDIKKFNKHLDAIKRLEIQRAILQLKRDLDIHTDVIKVRVDDIIKKYLAQTNIAIDKEIKQQVYQYYQDIIGNS